MRWRTRVRSQIVEYWYPLGISSTFGAWALSAFLGPNSLLIAITVGLNLGLVSSVWSSFFPRDRICKELERGDIEGALDKLTETLESTSGLERARMVLDIARLLVRCRATTEALTLFRALEQSELASMQAPARAGTLLCAALLADDVDEVTTRQDHVTTRNVHVFETACTGLALARAGHSYKVLELEVSNSRAYGGLRRYNTLESHDARLLFLLKAFVADSAKDKEKYLQRAVPNFAGEFEYVSENWQEMGEFIKGQMLFRRSLPAAHVHSLL